MTGVVISSASAKRMLADNLLGESLDEYVSRHRTQRQSWRHISMALREDIKLDIHPETLRLWFTEQPTKAAS